MNIGKISNDLLKKLLISNTAKHGPCVLMGPGVGKDCCILDFGDEVCVLSTDPITGAVNRAGYLGIHISCNDIATTGAQPIGVMLTILAPQGSSIDDIEIIMEDANEAAHELGISILGGHTEITPVVEQMIISVTAVGRIEKEKLLLPEKAMVGDDIIVTKTAGIEGTAILALDRENILKKHYSMDFIKKAADLMGNISVLKEGRIAGEFGAHTMHDATEGGILGALWEMTEAMGKGILVDIEKIPIAKETVEIAKFFDIDPLRLISSGSMIIVSPRGEELVNKLQQAQVQATIIGKVVESPNGKIRINGKEYIMDPPSADELHKALSFNKV